MLSHIKEAVFFYFSKRTFSGFRLFYHYCTKTIEFLNLKQCKIKRVNVMSKHYANANWEGNLVKGKGQYTLKTNGYVGKLNFSSRFEDDKSVSSPEELIGAALASCFSMALAHALDQAGNTPDRVETTAEVSLAKSTEGFAINEILLKTSATVKGVDNKKFLEIAEKTKKGCPVSKALTGTTIRLEAVLV